MSASDKGRSCTLAARVRRKEQQILERERTTLGKDNQSHLQTKKLSAGIFGFPKQALDYVNEKSQ